MRRVGCQFHWGNPGYRDFDDFLSTFTSAKRNKIKRERRHVREAGIDVRDLMPAMSDFNVDLHRLGPDAMLARLAGQLAPADALRFLRRRDAA